MLINDVMLIYKAALDSVMPQNLINSHINITDNRLKIAEAGFDLSLFENIYVIGAGKASAYMAQALENKLYDAITSGCITVKYGHSAPCRIITINEAGHPIPDQNSLDATQQILNMVGKAKENDLVIVLLSGGGSALMEALPAAISLQDLQSLNNQLIACGADIKEINTIRKHISLVKGGQLAQKIFPATCLTLIISDVPGDNLESIASGPTAADNSTFKEALDIIERYDLREKVSPAVIDYLFAGLKGDVPETLKKDSEHFNRVYNFIIGNNTLALQSAKAKAESLGYGIELMDTAMQGEVHTMANHIVEQMAGFSQSDKRQCLLFGGETTVNIKGKGKGGRNQELALAAMLALKNYDRLYTLLSCGTDGSDGPTDAAGAVIQNDSWDIAKVKNLNPQEYLLNNDSYHFFKKTGNLVKTGPSGTNVMDIVIILLD